MNYKNGKIYKIESHLGDKVYIGSTTKKYLSQRFSQHRSGYSRWKSGDKISHLTAFDMFDEYGLEHCDIVLVENFSCNSKDELHAREAYHIKLMNCVNKNIPCRSVKEWREIHKDSIKLYASDYYKENKKELNESSKVYYIDNNDKVKLKKKEYYQRKKESILDYQKMYRDKNVEAINKLKAEKNLCMCGSEITNSNKSRHEKSVKHMKYLNSLTQKEEQ